MIEQAAAALGRGNGADALAACAAHEQQLAAGQLTEERESLVIRSLVLLGRRDDARARATAFKQRFPDSLLTEVVDAALR